MMIDNLGVQHAPIDQLVGVVPDSLLQPAHGVCGCLRTPLDRESSSFYKQRSNVSELLGRPASKLICGPTLTDTRLAVQYTML